MPEPDEPDRDDADRASAVGAAPRRPVPSSESPTPRPTGPPEVEALHRIDELIGNRDKVGRQLLGEVRGIVLDTLGRWHAKVRDRQQLVAGGRPAPLVSELLESLDGGQGIAAFVLTPDVLDRLPILTRWPIEPAVAAEARLASMTGRRNRAREHAVRNERERDDALAEVERLRGQLASVIAERDRVRDARVEVEAERDAAREEVVRLSAALESEESLVRDLDGLQDREETSPHPIAEDPRRPRLDHFPDDAILLTYRELRQLVGLHLEACATSVAPADSARAMRDGETGLRLAEVLDR